MLGRKSICLFSLIGIALLGSGCQLATPLKMQARLLAIRLNLIQVPVASRRMSGTWPKSGKNGLQNRPFRFPGGMPPPQVKARMARMGQSFSSPDAVPEVNAALHLVQADSRIAPELGQNIALFDKYSYQSETFKDGTIRTEFEYGVKGTHGQGTMTGRTVSKSGAVSQDKLSVLFGSGKTVVLK